MRIDYDDLPESVQEHISRMRVEMEEVKQELVMHRFTTLVVLGWIIERGARWMGWI